MAAEERSLLAHPARSAYGSFLVHTACSWDQSRRGAQGPNGRVRLAVRERPLFVRKAEVPGLQKRGAQHVRIKGQAVGLSPTDASASWDRIWLVVSTPFQFSSRSGRGAGRNLAVASSALGWRQRMGRGSVGGDYTSRKGSSAASLPDCDRKFERVTPTSRTPFGGGNTDRIRSRAT